jgi:hypothetical protein
LNEKFAIARAPSPAREARALLRNHPALTGGVSDHFVPLGLARGNANVDCGEADGAGVANSGATEGEGAGVGVGDAVGVALGVGVGNGGIIFSQ